MFFQQLWRLIVEESDLFAQLNILKDFFLLGRGELFLAFIDCSEFLLRGIPTATTEHGWLISPLELISMNVLLS